MLHGSFSLLLSYLENAYRKSREFVMCLDGGDARALAALKDAAGWMEEEEEVKDWKAENSMNGSGKLKDADYGSPPASLSTNDGLVPLKQGCTEETTQTCGLLIH